MRFPPLEAILEGQRLALRCGLSKRAVRLGANRIKLKALARLARQHRKLANRTHLHQLTATIAARFGGIALEELKVKTMTASAKGPVERPGKNVRQKAGLNSEILEASPGMMISMRYKAERAAAWFAIIDARNTSQRCWQCGRTCRSVSKRCAH